MKVKQTKYPMRLTQDALTEVINELDSAADSLFWAEDALRLDDTPEKKRIDKLIAYLRERKETAPEGAWRFAHESEPYRDYEPRYGEQINGWHRISFNDEDHTAYASLFNPKYKVENEEPITTGDTVKLTWDDAVRIVFGAPVGQHKRQRK